MIGRCSDLLRTSTKPASANADTMPVKLETLGRLLSFASIGYPSTIFAPCSLAYSVAAWSKLTMSPTRLYGFATVLPQKSKLLTRRVYRQLFLRCEIVQAMGMLLSGLSNTSQSADYRHKLKALEFHLHQQWNVRLPCSPVLLACQIRSELFSTTYTSSQHKLHSLRTTFRGPATVLWLLDDTPNPEVFLILETFFVLFWPYRQLTAISKFCHYLNEPRV